MHDAERLTVDEFFDWAEVQDGRYELVDGRILPHADYFAPRGMSGPSAAHGRVIGNLTFALKLRLKPPCEVYVGVGVAVDDHNGNVPDVAVSCDEADSRGKKLRRPRFVFEVLSPSTRAIDLGRKVGDYLAISSVEAYVALDHERRAAILYPRDATPRTVDAGSLVLAEDVELDLEELF